MKLDSGTDLLFQDQEFINNQVGKIVILNFSAHKIKEGIYPSKYQIINFPIDVEINTPNIDLIILDFVKTKLIQNGFLSFNFIPIVILPNYQSIQLLVYHIIAELWDGAFPITARIVNSKIDPNTMALSYLVPALLKKRLRKQRDFIKNEGLIIKKEL